jgi:hypothetical protein
MEHVYLDGSPKQNIDVPMESERHGAIVLPSTLNNGTRNLKSTQAWC